MGPVRPAGPLPLTSHLSYFQHNNRPLPTEGTLTKLLLGLKIISRHKKIIPILQVKLDAIYLSWEKCVRFRQITVTHDVK